MKLLLFIVRKGRHHKIENGTMCTMNGIDIKQTTDGIVEVNCRPRFITMDMVKGHVSVRTPHVHIGVEVSLLDMKMEVFEVSLSYQNRNILGRRKSIHKAWIETGSC